MATMLNPNAIPDGSITKEKIDAAVLTTKQDKLTAGNGISIKDNKIDVTAITESESQPSTHLWVNPSEDAETNVTYNRSQIDALVGAKQDTLQLTVKDNGNIVLANLQGQSKEFMPATPSGDPMHWAYVAAGAEYNDTGADIVKDAPWADMLDDNPEDDGTKYGYEYSKVLHKAGCWYLNGIGDLSNNDMVQVYNHTNNFIRFTMDDLTSVYYGVPARTNIISTKTIWFTVKEGINMRDVMTTSKMEVINFNEYSETSHPITPGLFMSSFNFCSSLRFIINAHFNLKKAHSLDNTFNGTYNLIGVFLQKLTNNISFKDCGKLSKKSILYMINNEAATSAITITLHADAYARAMANADIVAALEAHPNVSLASA